MSATHGAPCPIEQGFRRASSGGVATLMAKSKRSAACNPARRDIVEIAGPGDRASRDRSAMLLEREHIGHDLAGMRSLCQAVDDGNGRVARDFRHVVVIENRIMMAST